VVPRAMPSGGCCSTRATLLRGFAWWLRVRCLCRRVFCRVYLLSVLALVAPGVLSHVYGGAGVQASRGQLVLQLRMAPHVKGFKRHTSHQAQPPSSESDGVASNEEYGVSPFTWLSPFQFYVLRLGGTEFARTSKYNYEPYSGTAALAGTYRCAGCGWRLFNASRKYESGTGWPSFWDPLPDGVQLADNWFLSALLGRECSCVRCGGHLGHAFRDGPRRDPQGVGPMGLRYCINGLALEFEAGAEEERL